MNGGAKLKTVSNTKGGQSDNTKVAVEGGGSWGEELKKQRQRDNDWV